MKRYSYNWNPQKELATDVLIVGSGIAGLYTALNIDAKLSVTVLTKESIDLSNSWLAQGGIAAAIKSDDTPEYHYVDTQVAGAELCDPLATETLVREGPGAIESLRRLNVPFDLNADGDLRVTREGGHHHNRIVHAGGDATGRETVKTLAPLVFARENVTLMERTMLADIVTDSDGKIVSAILLDENDVQILMKTANIVIATGGIGQIYPISTNPSVATGDGLAAAYRAGADLKDMEFVQFHPTALYDATGKYGERAFLISEAMRGEGALLKNRKGVRFMTGQHELAELAPRDIVARGILSELQKSGDANVFLDITHKEREFLEKRFPTIFNECLRRGIDISKDFIPVAPAYHYMMGGIKVDINARSNIPGLYAVGEAACTGVHGANRLASNSMLECLVFGKRAADLINASVNETSGNAAFISAVSSSNSEKLDYTALRNDLQAIMADRVGPVKTPKGLQAAKQYTEELLDKLYANSNPSKKYLELLNIAQVALAIIEASIDRKESIGSHYVIADKK
ncbi:MAG: L-aspartate oxidase [Oscillospiraceae bacterium]|jgi:L-aspartate oxidase|nr:L-aspartate oxidase [Oscillospiraceae bacterium]